MKTHWVGLTADWTVEEKMGELEDVAVETFQNETHREKKAKKNEQSISELRTASSSLIYI